jgi:hypothetical protein
MFRVFALTLISLSLRIHLYCGSVSEPSFSWCNEWDGSVGRLDRSSDRPCVRHLRVLVIHQEPTSCMDGLLLSNRSCLHGHLCVTPASSAVVEELTLTNIMPASCYKKNHIPESDTHEYYHRVPFTSWSSSYSRFIDVFCIPFASHETLSLGPNVTIHYCHSVSQ